MNLRGHGGVASYRSDIPMFEPDVDLTDVSPTEKRKRIRKWSDITGIVLHQTGIHNFGEKAWKKVTAHLGVHSDGRVFHIHPLPAYIYSSHGFNRDTVAIEVAGNFLGDENKPNSYWKKGGGPSELTEDMVTGIRRAIQWVVSEVDAHGGEVTHIFAHRQASDGRPLCPGAAIWKGGGVWAQEELGLSDGGPNYTRGDGLTIPDYWYPSVDTDTKNADATGESKREQTQAEQPVRVASVRTQVAYAGAGIAGAAALVGAWLMYRGATS